jgi:hypothetical protein
MKINKNKLGIASIALIMLLMFSGIGCLEEQRGERANMLDTQPTGLLNQSNERSVFQGYLDQVSNPNNIQYIYLFDYNGHVLFKSTVMGKTISATKSSEPYERFERNSNSFEYEYVRQFPGYIPGTPQLMNPSGMFGSDTPGVIWMTPDKRYHEWHLGPYLVSSTPLTFDTPVMSFHNIDIEMDQKVAKMKAKLATGGNLTKEEVEYLMSY